nr:hypothetical protein B0A51_17074 [Rachicladosporium sp. CCFEE 5018]
MSTPSIRDISHTQANTPPSGSARSSSIDDDSWIDHSIDDGLAHLASTRRPSQPRWRATRAPAPLQDVEPQQADVTQPEVTIKLHPLAAAPSGMASKVDYEAGLEFTREDKRAMVIVFLAVLAFTVVVIVAMVASGQQGKDGEWLFDHSRISMMNESSLISAFPSSTASTKHANTAQPSDAPDSLPPLATITPTAGTTFRPSATSQQQISTIETDSTAAQHLTPSSLEIAFITPTTVGLTSSFDSTVITSAVSTTSHVETSIDVTVSNTVLSSDISTDPPLQSTANGPVQPVPDPESDTPVVSKPITSSVSPDSDSITDSTPTLHSAVATSSVDVSTGWAGSLFMSMWTTPAKTVESTLDVVPTTSLAGTAAVPITTTTPTPEIPPQNARPGRRPGEVINSILQVIGEGLEQMDHH